MQSKKMVMGRKRRRPSTFLMQPLVTSMVILSVTVGSVLAADDESLADSSAGASALQSEIEIEVLSSPNDLVSGGDARVSISVPRPASARRAEV